MSAFVLEREAVTERRARAEQRASSPDVLPLLGAVASGGALDDEGAAALFLSARVETAALLRAAAERKQAGGRRIETFSPLYLTNECDAECRMCGMRGTNETLVRETADVATAVAQLDILRRRGLRAVALLTGEYRTGGRRREMLARTAEVLREALARGFDHVLVNVGALDAPEYPELLQGLPRRTDGRLEPHVTMCTFQETYDPDVYARFMGAAAENPRSDFARRLTNFDRACDAGMWAANPGVLLGLNPDVAWELLALLAHVRHLEARGMDVYVSLPRLRKASGTTHRAGIGDEALARLAATLALAVPAAKVVVSTREPPAVQRRLLPVIRVLTPGSPGVAPYTETGARFDLEASQFEVLDQRPFEAILGEVLATGTEIDCYEPPVPRAAGA